MLFSLIAPTKLIPKYGNQGDFHLTLSHLLDETPNEYEKTIKESSLPIYLDNGLFENGKSVPVDELMDHAARLNAVYVFAPDVLFNRDATEKNIDIAQKELQAANKRHNSQTKLAGVVQADNRKDYLEGYEWMVANESVSLIGISILAVPKSYEKELGAFNVSESRLLALRELKEQKFHKKSHLLGAGNSYIDIAYAARNLPWVDSHDSSSAIWNGVQGHEFNEDFSINGGKTKVHVDFDYDLALDGPTEEMIQNNINIAKKACGA